MIRPAIAAGGYDFLGDSAADGDGQPGAAREIVARARARPATREPASTMLSRALIAG
jgi:hypothetical protein